MVIFGYSPPSLCAVPFLPWKYSLLSSWKALALGLGFCNSITFQSPESSALFQKPPDSLTGESSRLF